MSENYYQDNIKLEEAMTMDLTQSIRAWILQGLHVQDEDIPENANVQSTVVIKFPEGHLLLGIQWTVEGDKMIQISDLAEFSTLEELKDKFPNLFELEGSLCAIA